MAHHVTRETLQATNFLLIEVTTMGGAYFAPSAPIVSRPKKPRRATDYGALILPRTKRLTPSFWILKEGLLQDVRSERVSGLRTTRTVSYDWRREQRIAALKREGWLEESKGPRGGRAFRTTGDGAFMVLVAEAQVEARRLKRDKNG